MVKAQRKRWYDDEADWMPEKGRAFEFKRGVQQEPPQKHQRQIKPTPLQHTIKTDAEGLEKAYQQGDYFHDGDTLYVAGSHTARDWHDDFTKIPAYDKIPNELVNLMPRGLGNMIDMMKSQLGKVAFGAGDLRQAERYQIANGYLEKHPEVKKLVGRSLGGAVVIQLAKNHPERDLKSITYNAPVWDPLGRDAPKDGNYRFGNYKDPASIFDRSATATNHPDWWKYRPGFTHDYHGKEQAGGRLDGLPVESTRP